MSFTVTRIVGRLPKQTALCKSITHQCRHSSAPAYKLILVEKKGAKQNVGLVTLNRPKALNALCDELVGEMSDAIIKLQSDDGVGAVVITGSEKAFAAGADVKEMYEKTFSGSIKRGILEQWINISKCRKPVIAAVNGFALGGGCELALMCDIIYAGEKAKFGQLEILLGLLPGQGGTQRIARSCGKSKAMEMCLTGDQISAQEAERMGLVSKVFPPDQLVAEAIKLGEKIASNSQIMTIMCKESVNNAFEMSLEDALRVERRMFYACFATEDRKEGMTAFLEKRAPIFKHE